MPRDDRLWVPLDASYEDDERIVDITVEAELMFIRSLCLAKRRQTDGVIRDGHVRRLTDKFEDVNPTQLVHELCDAGLWTATDDGYEITSWQRWNLAAGEIEERRERKRMGGKRGNHNRHGHEQPFRDCTICHAQPGGSSHSESDSDRIATGVRGVSESLSDRTSLASPRESKSRETEREQIKPLVSSDEDTHAEDDDLERFEAHFWPAYPSRNGKKRQKGKTLQKWRQLTLDQQRRALVGARHYADAGEGPMDPFRFLTRNTAGEFPFDDWQTPAKPSAAGVPRHVREHDTYDRMLSDVQRQLEAQT